MVRGKAASSSTSLAYAASPSLAVGQWLPGVLALLRRCTAPGGNQPLWNADLERPDGPDSGVDPHTTGVPPPQLARLRVRAEADAGLIDDGSTYCVDHGGTYHFTLNISDGRGAIVGLPLLPAQTLAGGVVYRCAGPSDGNGDIRISVDTRQARPGQSHALVLPGLGACVNVKVYEFVQVRLVDFARVGERVKAELELSRRDDRTFSDLGTWRGYVRLGEGPTAPFLRGHSPSRVPVSTGWLPANRAVTLQVRLSFPSSLDRLLVGDVDLLVPPAPCHGD